MSFPTKIVRTYLGAARLPLDVAERVLQRDSSREQWAPALLFDSVEANVKQVVGAFLRDDELVEEGRVSRARVAQLKKAAHLETLADQKRAEAAAEYEERKQADEQQRAAIEEEARQREAALERDKDRRRREAEAKARKKAEAAAKIEEVEQKAIARQERAARATRVEAEQEVLVDQREAVEATEAVLDLDRALQTTKSVRKSR